MCKAKRNKAQRGYLEKIFLLKTENPELEVVFFTASVGFYGEMEIIRVFVDTLCVESGMVFVGKKEIKNGLGVDKGRLAICVEFESSDEWGDL